jgi:hypothetical protein
LPGASLNSSVVLGMPPAAREAGGTAPSTSAEIAPASTTGGIARLATNSITRLRTAFAARRRGTATLPARRPPYRRVVPATAIEWAVDRDPSPSAGPFV